MIDISSASPTTEQIRLQLERLLDSDRFKNAPIQSAFIEFVTKRAISGKKSTEDQIGRAVFPKFIKDESGDVRQAARNLRKTLLLYYENEGIHDLVLIQLPSPPKDKKVKLKEGESYTPVFKYNRQNETQKRYELSTFLKSHSLRDDPTINENLANVLQSEPNHVDALLTFAELNFDPYLAEGNDENFQQMLSDINLLVDKALRLAPQYWRAHAVKAYLISDSSVQGAEAEFGNALALDKKATETSPQFLKYLIRLSRHEDIVAILKPHLETHFEDQRMYAFLAYGLLGLGRDDEAEQTLRFALRLDTNNVPVLLMLARFCLKRLRAKEATEYLGRLRFLLDPDNYARMTEHL
jgi:tetratricopeptide (TPR) repeat protein